MNVHTEVVPYCWTEIDRLAEATRIIPGLYVTPYRIPRGALNGATAYAAGQLVHIPLGASDNAAVVGRFFREGYAWVPLPDGVDPTGMNMHSLFEALFALDPVRFAHFDPAVVMAMAARLAAETLPGGPAIRGIDPMLMPYADLAQLHFDYWGNTRLRGAVVAAAITPETVTLFDSFSLELPWFGDDLLVGLLPVLVPSAIPTERNGVKIERVLARVTAQGLDLRAVPRRVGGGVSTTLRVSSLQPPRIELDGWRPQRLEPLRPDEWRLGASRVRFRVTTPFPALQVRVEILRGEAVYYQEVHESGELVSPGLHVFTWDGRDQQGVWDSTVLKENNLRARLTVVDAAGRLSVASATLHTAPSTVRWVDARIDPSARTVTVDTYGRYRRPSELELFTVNMGLPTPLGMSLGSWLGEAGLRLPTVAALPTPGVAPGIAPLDVMARATSLLAPPSLARAAQLPLAGATGVTSLSVGAATAAIVGDRLRVRVSFPPLFDLDDELFERLRGITLDGIHKHWSRVGDRAVAIDGEGYDLEVFAHERVDDAVNIFLCRTLPEALGRIGLGDGTADRGDLGTRPFNSAFVEGWPIVIFWNDDERETWRPTIGAHEIGHTVLREYRDIVYSATHKGTSDFGLDQQPTRNAPTRQSEFDANGEVDLMHYHPDVPEDDRALLDEANVATEDDARGLITLATVMFG